MAHNLVILPIFLFEFVILDSLPSLTFKMHVLDCIRRESRKWKTLSTSFGNALPYPFFFPHGGAIITDLYVLQRLFILPKMKEKGYIESKHCYPSILMEGKE